MQDLLNTNLDGKLLTESIQSLFSPGGPLGSGTYSTVYEIEKLRNKKGTGALKVYKQPFQDIIHAKSLLREIILGKNFHHRNVTFVFDAHFSSTANTVCLAFPKMDLDLRQVLVTRDSLTDAHIRFFIYQILCAIKYVHSAGIIHRDIKPENILVNNNCEIRLADFGMSCSEGEINKSNYVVTRWYRSPEIILQCEYDTSSDIWSVGCIFAELMLNRVLFKGKNTQDQLNQIISVLGTPVDRTFITNSNSLNYIQKLPKYSSNWSCIERLDSDAIDLLVQMICWNPKHRYTATDALKHRYLKCFEHLKFDTEYEGLEKITFSFENENNNLSSYQHQIKQEIMLCASLGN